MKTARTLAILAVTVTCVTAIPATAATAATTATAATAATALPNSMTALGDSITRAFNACGLYSDCVSKSWSTGTEVSINSHYLRIKKANPGIGDRVYNDARSGAKISDLPFQAGIAASRHVEHVTILMGGNDVCTRTEREMTSVSAYRTQLDSALDKLKSGLPNATIYLLSVPDVRRLWEIGKDDSSARSAWNTFGICQSMLANPTSTAQADVDRRTRVRQRVVDYNTQLAQACAAYGPRCSFDDNVVFNYQFEIGQVSRLDYFHPNAEGQKVLAEATYRM